MHYLRMKLEKNNKSWRVFELECLDFYNDILEYLLSNLDMWNDIQQSLITTDISWGLKMANTYRNERIKILRN